MMGKVYAGPPPQRPDKSSKVTECMASLVYAAPNRKVRVESVSEKDNSKANNISEDNKTKDNQSKDNKTKGYPYNRQEDSRSMLDVYAGPEYFERNSVHTEAVYAPPQFMGNDSDDWV